MFVLFYLTRRGSLSRTHVNLLPRVCYSDLAPKLDGQYLFRDYETTLRYIREADSNTSRKDAPLYALWILSEHVEDLIGLIEQHLSGVG